MLTPVILGVIVVFAAAVLLGADGRLNPVRAQSNNSFYGLLQKLEDEAIAGNKVILEVMLGPSAQKYLVIGYVSYVGSDFACFESGNDNQASGFECVVYDKILGITQRSGDLKEVVVPQ